MPKPNSKRKKRTPHQKKGDALENAVNRIEQYLLKITPELSEQDFKFETKKLVSVDGGHREIDIYVTRKAAHGYESVFIYEYRNRKKSANWVDIAAFPCSRMGIPESESVGQSISSGTMWERGSSPQAFSRTRPRFSLGSGLCPI